ncbi:MAG: DUF1573 domain-containing protein [bacterium]|nr:DUF1573 domain-containing protein [bacterium]
MESKTIGIATLVFILIVLLFAWGRAGTNFTPQGAPGATSIAQSSLIASETLYDFGTISMKNGLVNKEFTITNPTNLDIMATTVLTSCMCTLAYIVKENGDLKGPFGMPGMGYVPPANELIKAGESRVIRVIYDPNAHGPAGVGRIDRFITLTDASGGALQLEIKALVTP